MATAELELRSKEEIAEDIERNRHQARSAYVRTKTAVVERNPAVLAWRATKQKCFEAKQRSVVQARRTDLKVRTNLYRTIAFAAIAGIVVGLFAPRKNKVILIRED
jgi:ElaB/YqjD/DUF883 family membrane-anchored ribosome-binding protein